MSSMWMFGRICEPPKMVITPRFTAWLVMMLTVRSSWSRGA
jgi:hypothetical protein